MFSDAIVDKPAPFDRIGGEVGGRTDAREASQVANAIACVQEEIVDVADAEVGCSSGPSGSAAYGLASD